MNPPSPPIGYKATRSTPQIQTSLPPANDSPPHYDSLFSHSRPIQLYHSLHEPSRLCGKKKQKFIPSIFHVAHPSPSKFNAALLPSHFRNDSNFAQPLWRWSVHNARARKSQDPQPHRIVSGTVPLLRLHANPRGHAIDVKLSQKRTTLE